MWSAKVHKETKTAEQAIEAFATIASSKGCFPVLFIDEASLAFSSERDQTSNKAVLALLISMTKQRRQLNVVLGSSEHAYPFLKKDLDFNLMDISTIFAGEVPPVRMRELLTKHWGLGDRLADRVLPRGLRGPRVSHLHGYQRSVAEEGKLQGGAREPRRAV
jgi:hypothetical protein